jgi:hypothetical protein
VITTLLVMPFNHKTTICRCLTRQEKDKIGRFLEICKKTQYLRGGAYKTIFCKKDSEYIGLFDIDVVRMYKKLGETIVYLDIGIEGAIKQRRICMYGKAHECIDPTNQLDAMESRREIRVQRYTERGFEITFDTDTEVHCMYCGTVHYMMTNIIPSPNRIFLVRFFSWRAPVSVHMLRHVNLKPCPCMLCVASCNSRKAPQDHVRETH